VKVRGIAQSVRSQGKMESTWVEQLLACALQEVLDGLLGNAILEVGVCPTKGELLPCVVACLSEGIVLKASIVAVVVQDFDSVLGYVLFKSKLGGKCFG
jgi:hypothetical protein